MALHLMTQGSIVWGLRFRVEVRVLSLEVGEGSAFIVVILYSLRPYSV